jgi:O-antigen/teichoic acid export membrane protein
MFPLAFGLGAVAETVGQAFFDRTWAGIGPMLMYLAILSAPRPMAQIVGAYLYAGQRIRVVVWLEWLSLGALLAAIAAFGAGMAGSATVGPSAILWTCGAVGCVFVLRTLAHLWVVTWLDGVPLRSFLVPMIRPLAVCIAMVAAILAVRPELADLSPRLRLLVEIAIGAAIYGAGALVIFRDSAVELIAMVRSSMSRG